MEMNADWMVRVALDTASMQWREAAGMSHKWLDRVDAPASDTRMVESAAGGSLDAPAEGQGEQILVLEGTLADERGEYAAGTYLRNPPGAWGTLHSAAGLRAV